MIYRHAVRLRLTPKLSPWIARSAFLGICGRSGWGVKKRRLFIFWGSCSLSSLNESLTTHRSLSSRNSHVLVTETSFNDIHTLSLLLDYIHDKTHRSSLLRQTFLKGRQHTAFLWGYQYTEVYEDPDQLTSQIIHSMRFISLLYTSTNVDLFKGYRTNR